MRPNADTGGIILENRNEVEMGIAVLKENGFERLAKSLETDDDVLHVSNPVAADFVLQGLRKIVPKASSGRRLSSRGLFGDKERAALILEDYEEKSAFESGATYSRDL